MQVTIIFSNGTSSQLTLTSNVNIKLRAEALAWSLNTFVEAILVSR